MIITLFELASQLTSRAYADVHKWNWKYDLLQYAIEEIKKKCDIKINSAQIDNLMA